MSDQIAPVDRSTMRSVERAFDVVDFLAGSGGPVRLSDIARGTSLHIATAQRILRVLEQRDYVTQGTAGYSVGPAALAAAHSYLADNHLILSAMPVLQELATALGLTASLSVQIASSRLLVARVEGASPLRYQLPVGGRLPLHLGAGKIFLAYMEPAARDEILSRLDSVERASGEVIPIDEFVAGLDEIAAAGYAVSRGERVLDTVSVSAPVRARSEGLLGVIQVTGREEDLTPEKVRRVIPDVINAGVSIATRAR